MSDYTSYPMTGNAYSEVKLFKNLASELQKNEKIRVIVQNILNEAVKIHLLNKNVKEKVEKVEQNIFKLHQLACCNY